MSVLTVILFCFEIYLFNIVAITATNSKHLSDEIVQKLKFAAQNYQNSINAETDPCDDYKEYICKNWNTTGHEILKQQEDIYEEFIEKLSSNESALSEIERKVKTFYASCQQGSLNFPEQFKELQITKYATGWPIFNSNWTEEKFDRFSIMGILRSYDNLARRHSVEFKRNILQKFGVPNDSIEQVISEVDSLQDGTSANIAPVNVLMYKVIESIANLYKESVNYGSCKKATVAYFQPYFNGRILKENFNEYDEKSFLSVLTKYVNSSKELEKKYLYESFIAYKYFEMFALKRIAFINNRNNSTYLNELNTNFTEINITSSNYYLQNLLNLAPLKKIERYLETIDIDNIPIRVRLYYREKKIEDEMPEILFRTHNQPMSVKFAIISSWAWSKFFSSCDSEIIGSEYENVISCTSQQVGRNLEQEDDEKDYNIKAFLPTTPREIYITESFRYALRDYNAWIEENPQIYEAENKILLEYGFDSKKLFFFTLIQWQRCLISSLPFKNIDEFADVNNYNCPTGSSMNPKMKCKLFS